MNTDIVDLVLLINGNFARTTIELEKVPAYKKMLCEKISQEKEDSVVFINSTFFKASKLDGFYFTEHYEPQKSLDTESFNKFIKKASNEIGGGEDWKGE